MTATHASVEQLTEKVKGHGYKLYMDSIFSLPDLFIDMTQKRNSCFCLPIAPHLFLA
jgi:hypothetical protein